MDQKTGNPHRTISFVLTSCYGQNYCLEWAFWNKACGLTSFINNCPGSDLWNLTKQRIANDYSLTPLRKFNDMKMTHVITNSWESERKYTKGLMNRWRKKTGNWHFWLRNTTIHRRATGQSFLHTENNKSFAQSQQMPCSEEWRLRGQICWPSVGVFHLTAYGTQVKEAFVYLLSSRSPSSRHRKAGPTLGPGTDNIYTHST